MTFFSHHRLFVSLSLAVCLLGAGCDRADDKIIVYRAPKGTSAETGPAAGAPEHGGSANLHWTAAAGWEEQPASGFRKGSFLVRGAEGKTADVSVISFPEAAGGLLANVNRWRDQLKLAPITEEAQAGTTMDVNGRSMALVDLVSEGPIPPGDSKMRILGGILPVDGETWFFKMMGPDDLVAAQRDAFKEFLQSVHPAHTAAGATSASAAPVAASSGPAATATPVIPPEPPPSGEIKYALPPNWQEKPLTPMRLASFSATAPNGKQVDVSIVTLSGAAGGDLANVNRWRDQLKLGPIDEPTLRQTSEHVQADGHDFLVVDLVSDATLGEAQEKQRIVAAILNETDRSWFVKMAGEDEAVASQKSAFVDLLRSLKIP